MRFYGLVLGSLGVWRVTHLLHAEDGPGRVLVRLRRELQRDSLPGLFDCFYCLSVWVSLPFACVIGRTWRERLLLWPALSGGAIAVHHLAIARDSYPPATYFEEREHHELLRPPPDRLSDEGAALDE